MNPAVSFALASTGQIPLLTCALYIVAQCMGTTLGAQILVGFTPKKFTWSLGVTQLAKGVSPMQGLVFYGLLRINRLHIFNCAQVRYKMSSRY